MRNIKLFYWALFVSLLVFIASCTTLEDREITNFEECAKAGYPILTTAPQQCKTPDGKTFIEQATEVGENIGQEQETGSAEKGGVAGEVGTETEEPEEQEGIISTDAEEIENASKNEVVSTFGPCKTNEDCYVDEECVPNRCQSKSEPALMLCIDKNKIQPATPKELGYNCECLDSKCQWTKNE